MPTGSQELTLNKYASISKLSVSHNISENMGLGYNIGYNYFGENNGDFTYSAVMGISINENAGCFIEFFGDYQNFEFFYSNFDMGFTYLLKENFQLDFSYGFGINYKSNFISAGFSWNIFADK